jgi:hypothetical protein
MWDFESRDSGSNPDGAILRPRVSVERDAPEVMKVLPFSPDGDQDRVSLLHYNIGCLVYGKDVIDEGLKEFKIRVAVEGRLRGLK